MNPSASAQTLVRRMLDLGGMRLALLLAVAVLLIVVPAPGTRGVLAGWPLATTVLAPVLAPILFLLLLLDALMARVFLSDASGDARRRLKTAVLVNLIAAGVMLLRWLPYYLALRA